MRGRRINKNLKEKILTVYQRYKTQRTLTALIFVLVYIILSIIIYSLDLYCLGLYSLDIIYWILKALTYFLMAVQNIAITMFSVIFVDIIISNDYKEQLKKYIVDILSNPVLMKEVISVEKSKEVLKSSMDAVLGEGVSKN